jgi:hypothetical protein
MVKGVAILLTDDDIRGGMLGKAPPSLFDFKVGTKDAEEASVIIYHQTAGVDYILKNRIGKTGFII